MKSVDLLRRRQHNASLNSVAMYAGRMHYFLLAAIALVAVIPAQASSIQVSGIADIIDGDTLTIGPVIVRLNGVDAPEAGQTCQRFNGEKWDCGTAATQRLAGLVEGRHIDCFTLDQDVYGRLVSRCELDGQDIGRILVSEGAAWAFRRFTEVYADDEDRAKAAGLGIWSGDNETPSEFRASRWDRAAAEAPVEGCPIKGNIARDGDRIYHTPWSPWYGRTKIDTSNGERWFCDEAEAQAAGWRPPRWH